MTFNRAKRSNNFRIQHSCKMHEQLPMLCCVVHTIPTEQHFKANHTCYPLYINGHTMHSLWISNRMYAFDLFIVYHTHTKKKCKVKHNTDLWLNLEGIRAALYGVRRLNDITLEAPRGPGATRLSQVTVYTGNAITTQEASGSGGIQPRNTALCLRLRSSGFLCNIREYKNTIVYYHAKHTADFQPQEGEGGDFPFQVFIFIITCSLQIQLCLTKQK